MKAIIYILFLTVCFNSYSQNLDNAEAVLDKYLEVTKLKGNHEAIKDLSFTYTSETPRGVSETEFKYTFPFKSSMTIFASGMEIMSSKFDGEKIATKSNWGNQGNQEPKVGEAAINQAFRGHPYYEAYYKTMGVSASLVGTEKLNDQEHYIVEFKDSQGKTWKDFYNVNTGFKSQTKASNETPRGVVESTVIYEDYKTFKGSEILFASKRKQATQMGEIVSELQSVKINKGLKAKDFEIK
jgi:hypothetical protein